MGRDWARALSGACALLLAALVTALAGAGCGTVGLSEEGTGDRVLGKELFTANCGSCHVLADAGTAGVIGPNLDDAFLQSRADGIGNTTIQSIVRGPTQEPPTGVPGMPADIVTGEDAEAVAAYVASVAGLPAEGGAVEAGGGQETGGETTEPTETEPTETGAAGGTEPAGKAVFADNGCGTCHTLAAAGSNGTIGPNLDETKPSKELAIDRVTNGSGAMPSFADSLSEEQIEMVADFVSSSAGTQ